MTHHLGTAILALALWLTPLEIGIGGTYTAEQDDLMVLTGTVSKLDLDRLRGLLTTDMGMRVFFEVPKAYLFENIQIGARITLQLDSYGRAVKVMDTSLPDLLTIPATVLPRAGSAEPLTATLNAPLRKILEERR